MANILFLLLNNKYVFANDESSLKILFAVALKTYSTHASFLFLNYSLYWECNIHTDRYLFGKLKVLTKAVLTINVAVVSMIINCNSHKFCSLNLKEFNRNLKNNFNFKGKILSS